MQMVRGVLRSCWCEVTLFGVIWLLSTCSTVAAGEEFVLTKAKQGLLRGRIERTLSGKKYASYYIIPYARPPVGELRFKDPVPAGPWAGELNATGPENKLCTQIDLVTLLQYGDEDCLILNVHTPKISPTSKLSGMEVLVIIHGGAFSCGYAGLNSPLYIIDKADFIIVSMNYRLDVLGFLCTEDTVIQGNYGLKDQSLALKWVHENIADFGGDPKKMSTAGFSAGGSSLGYHLVSPLSKGLIRSAVFWSGSPLTPWSFVREPKKKASKFATLVNCPTYNHHAMLDCLRNRPAMDLMKASYKFRTFADNFPLSPFAPTIEVATSNYFMNDSVENLLKDKQAMDVPILFTSTVLEGIFLAAEFLDDGIISAKLDQQWNEIGPQILSYNDFYPESLRNEVSSKIREAYLNGRPIIGNSVRVIQMMTDRHFLNPFYKFFSLYTANYESPVHYIKFTFATVVHFAEFFPYGHNEEPIKGHPGHVDDMFFTAIVIPELKFHLIQPKFKQISDALLTPVIALTKRKEEELSWPTVNSDPAGFTYLKVDDPTLGQIVEVEAEMGNSKFWETLPPDL